MEPKNIRLSLSTLILHKMNKTNMWLIWKILQILKNSQDNKDFVGRQSFHRTVFLVVLSILLPLTKWQLTCWQKNDIFHQACIIQKLEVFLTMSVVNVVFWIIPRQLPHVSIGLKPASADGAPPIERLPYDTKSILSERIHSSSLHLLGYSILYYMLI